MFSVYALFNFLFNTKMWPPLFPNVLSPSPPWGVIEMCHYRLLLIIISAYFITVYCGYKALMWTPSRAPQRFHQQPSAQSRLLLNINPSPSSLHYDSTLITCFVSIDFPQASAHLDVKLFWPRHSLASATINTEHACALVKIPSAYKHGNIVHANLWLPWMQCTYRHRHKQYSSPLLLVTQMQSV